MITSRANPRLRYVRRLDGRAFRRREGRFVVEGVRLVEEALAAGTVPDFVLVTGALDRTERGAELCGLLEGIGRPVLDVEPGLLADVSGTSTPQGVLAVVPVPDEQVPPSAEPILVVDALRDAGNLGTVLRTALAAGVGAVLLAPGTVDATGPKVVRAAMGAHFRIVVRHADWAAIARHTTGLSIVATAADGAERYADRDWRTPTALVVGNEAHGLSPSARALCHATVRIPMPGPAESLNAASAAAVLLFEIVRQRSGQS